MSARSIKVTAALAGLLAVGLLFVLTASAPFSSTSGSGVTVMNQPLTTHLSDSSLAALVTPSCFVRPRAWQTVSTSVVDVPLDGGSSDRTAIILTNFDAKNIIACTASDPTVNPSFTGTALGSYLFPFGGSVKYGVRSTIPVKCLGSAVSALNNLVVEEEICR